MRIRVVFAAIICALSASVALSAGVARPAWAAERTTAVSTYTVLSSVATPIRTAHGSTTFFVVDHAAYKGDISGMPVDTYLLTVQRTGKLNGHGIETCTCTLGGRTGSYVAVFSFKGTAAFFVGHITILFGADGLAGLRAKGTFQGNATTGTITLNYHFEF
jgi:hypothetical protein